MGCCAALQAAQAAEAAQQLQGQVEILEQQVLELHSLKSRCEVLESDRQVGLGVAGMCSMQGRVSACASAGYTCHDLTFPHVHCKPGFKCLPDMR